MIDNEIEELKKMATLQMRVFNKDTPVSYQAFVTDSSGNVTFPRYMIPHAINCTKAKPTMSILCPPKHEEVVKHCDHWDTAPVPWRTQRTLDPTRQQDEAVKRVLQSVSEIGGALLCLPCGYGKTTCACVIIGQLARRTFVMVNTNELAKQWCRELLAVLPDCTVSHAPDLSGNIVVGTFQLVTRGGLDISDVDVLVVDEAHHVPAGTFCHAVSLFRRDVTTIGLTATPRRRDGLEKLIEWTLGPLAFSITREDLVRAGKTPPGNYLVHTVQAPPRTNNRPVMPKRYEKFPLVYWRQQLSTCTLRNAALVNEIIDMVTKQSRSVLVLTMLRSHASCLVKQLSEQGISSELLLGGAQRAKKRTRDNIKNDTRKISKANVNDRPADFEQDPEYTREQTPDQRSLSEGIKSEEHNIRHRRCIVATAQLVGEGFDVAELDGLVIALPCSDIEQLVGRVMRQHPDKVWPVRIIDVFDQNAHEIVTALYWKRRHQMKKILGGNVFFE